jgi:CheY-like chemotaxis protein
MQRSYFTPVTCPGAVLVADDEPTVLLLLIHLLEEAGITVAAACDGRGALERFRAAPHEFRLVLLDAGMPGLGGPDLLAAVRALRPDVPAVVMSGDSPDAVAARFADLEVASFLSKPFRCDALLAQVRPFLGHHPHHRVA